MDNVQKIHSPSDVVIIASGDKSYFDKNKTNVFSLYLCDYALSKNNKVTKKRKRYRQKVIRSTRLIEILYSIWRIFSFICSISRKFVIDFTIFSCFEGQKRYKKVLRRTFAVQPRDLTQIHLQIGGFLHIYFLGGWGGGLDK